MGATFSAADVRWQDDARCAGNDSVDFVPDSENPQTLEFIRSAWCDLCPVRTECLAYALLYHLSGYWGGTGTSERRLLSYHRDRAKCPLARCRSKALVRTTDGYEICLRCGTSWMRGAEPGVPSETAG